MTTKELKLALVTLASETVKNSTAQYVADNLDDAILTNIGWVISRKQPLEKDFCFSYDPAIKGDYENAVEMVRYVKRTPDYFVTYNLRYYDEVIKQLENNNVYFISSYFDFPDAPFVDIINEREAKYFKDNKYNNVKLGKFSEKETEMLLKFFKKLRAKQEKRCNTYIKKYGLKKIHAWSYDRWN